MVITDGVEYVRQVKIKKLRWKNSPGLRERKNEVKDKETLKLITQTLIGNKILENNPFNRENSHALEKNCQTYLL